MNSEASWVKKEDLNNMRTVEYPNIGGILAQLAAIPKYTDNEVISMINKSKASLSRKINIKYRVEGELAEIKTHKEAGEDEISSFLDEESLGVLPFPVQLTKALKDKFIILRKE